MHDSSLTVLLGAAVTIAAVHTLIGVDHSLPFIALARARRWSLRRTLSVTALCGVAHVLSSVAIGAVGLAIGTALGELERIESARGAVAAWMLIGFGLAYAAHAFVRAQRSRGLGQVHASGQSALAFWSLFVVFALGPCEPLIPLLMAPAAVHDWTWVALVAGAFGAVTIATMLAVVSIGYVGAARLRGGAIFERHAGVLAGLAIACSGLAIELLGI